MREPTASVPSDIERNSGNSSQDRKSRNAKTANSTDDIITTQGSRLSILDQQMRIEMPSESQANNEKSSTTTEQDQIESINQK